MRELGGRLNLPWRGLILFGIAVIATVIFVAIAKQVLEGHADPIDRQLALAIRRADHPVLDALMLALTGIGSGPAVWLAIALTSAWAIRRGRRALAVILVASGLITQLVSVLLKLYFVRQRPTLFDEITRPETFSFPSGHAMSAMVVFGAIATVAVALRPSLRRRIVTVAALLIAGIGLSRVYLGVHWPLDVLAGFVAGVPIVVVTVHLIHELGQRTPRARARRAPTRRS